jgi:hypothetical protein
MSLSGGGSARGMGVVSDMPQPQPQLQPGAGGAGRELKKQRLKREDHTRVKHDDRFSDWKVRKKLPNPSFAEESSSLADSLKVFRGHLLSGLCLLIRVSSHFFRRVQT